MTKDQLNAMAAQVHALSLPQKLFVASELAQRRQFDIAETIARTAMDEFAWMRLFPDKPFPRIENI